MNEALAQMRNVFEEHDRVPERNMVEQHQMLVNLSHIADVRHYGEAKLSSEQADRNEFTYTRYTRAIHLDEVYGTFAHEILEHDAVRDVLAEGYA